MSLASIKALAMATGALVALGILLVWLWRKEHGQEFMDLIHEQLEGPVATAISTKLKTNWSYRGALRKEALIINQPERADLWYRVSMIGCFAPLLLILFFRQFWAIFLIPVILGGTLFYAQELRKAHHRAMQRQARFTKLLIAFLTKSGLSLSDTLHESERGMDEPIRSKLHEVNVKKRFTTLPKALTALAASTGITELRNFAVIVSESESFGTPVSQGLMESIKLESKLRQARAARRRGELQVKLGLYMTMGIAIPGFGFVIYAMISYAMHLLSNSFF